MAATAQDQLPTPPQLDICQKCGNSIAHVPYKFNNQTFHAVCLKCNFCGKKLVGKPFITEESKIFCGEQCKKDFATIPCSELNANSEEEPEDTGTFDESLLEALESIKESNQELLKLSSRSPPVKISDPDRLTDYPRSSSPDLSTFSPLSSSLRSSPLYGSRRSSLSAVSDCSITSEGSSMSFDASGKPRKNILKKPPRSRRRSKNNRHVRWNLPNGSNDSDTTSLESFDSASTTSSSVYNRARNGVAHSRQNWREHDPPSGSTGLTPARQAPPAGSFRRMPSPTHSPLHVSSPSHSGYSGVSRVGSNELLGGFRRSPSPLTTASPSHSPQHSYDSTAVMHSTPVRQQYSESSRLTNSQRREQSTPTVASPERSMQHSFLSHDESVESSFKIPVLKLNESSLPDLDDSTLEDKKKANIVDLTQFKRDTRHQMSPSPSKLMHNQSPIKPTAAAFLNDDDDDADDYDHLSPLKEDEIAAKKKERALRKAHRAMKKEILQKQRKGATKNGNVSSLYSDEHIDEALREIEVEDDNCTKDLSPVAEIAPPLPPRKEMNEVASEQSSQSPPQHTQSPPSSPSVAQPSYHPSTLSSQHTDKAMTETQAPTTTRTPPPVPPKTRRISRQQRDSEGNPVIQQSAPPPAPLRGKFKPLPPLPEDASSPKQSRLFTSNPQHNHQSETQPYSTRKGQENTSSPKFNHQSIETQKPDITSKWSLEGSSDLADILPPPPEFAIPPPSRFSDNDSQANTPPDDPLSSVSNTTLVADQDEVSSPDTSDSLRQSLPDLISDTARTSRSRDSNANKVGCLSMSAQQLQKNEHSWNALHSTNTKNWSREETRTNTHHSEAESMKSGSEPFLDIQGSMYNQAASYNRLVKSTSHDPDSYNPLRVSHDSQGERPNHPQPVQYRISMEQAFTERNVVNSTTISPASPSPHSHHRMTSEQALRMAGNPSAAKLKRAASSPQRPLRHPKVADQFTREDQQVVERFYPGARLPMMKRVIHDTERSIQAMLAEMESDKEGSGDEKHSRTTQHRTCSVCSKPIRTIKELISHEGHGYHVKCYKCATCRSSLRGKKVHRVRNSIVCRDCYPTFGISNPQSSNTRRPDQQVSSYLPYHDLRRGPVASGQVTSV